MRDLFDIQGKVALVTGGGRGIGAMIARGYVENGARVYIASRDAEACAATAAELSQRGECIALQADISTLDGIRKLGADFSLAEPKLDILVNNAGLAGMEMLEEFSESAWDTVMDLNAKSMFFTVQTLLPRLRAAASAETPARIINITSIAGLRPPPFDAFAYSASKAAAGMLTRHLAKRLASEQILVNAICPGPFPTDMMAAAIQMAGDHLRAANPLKRLGTAEDIAGCALFLAGRASAWTTGAIIPCDGGEAEIA